MNTISGSVRSPLSAALLSVTVLPLAAGTLIAPHVFNLLLLIGRSWERFEWLRQLEFESVLTRSILVVALLAVWPATRLASAAGLSLRRLFKAAGFRRELGRGLLIGIFSMGLIPLVGLLVGSYEFRSDLEVSFVAGSFFFLLAALLVAVLEETLFRGLIFGYMDMLFRRFPAALLAGLLYSLVHFLNPMRPTGVVHGHWYSGFQVLRTAIVSFDPTNIHIFPYSLTLLLIGIALCLVVSERGNIIMVVGIHAGWIWVLKISARGLSRTDSYGGLFGHDMIISKTYAATLVAAVFMLSILFIGYARRYRRKLNSLGSSPRS